MPERTASSTRYWMAGLSTRGSIPLGMALVAGSTRVPRPAAGMTAFGDFFHGSKLLLYNISQAGCVSRKTSVEQGLQASGAQQQGEAGCRSTISSTKAPKTAARS